MYHKVSESGRSGWVMPKEQATPKSHYFKTTKVYFWLEGPVPFCLYSSWWNLLHSYKGVENITNCPLVVKASFINDTCHFTHILLAKEVTWPHLTSRSKEEVHQEMYLGWASQSYWRTLVTTRYSISQFWAHDFSFQSSPEFAFSNF